MEHRAEGDAPTLHLMSQQVRELDSDDGPASDIPFVDHEAVRQTVRFHRARRKARTEHRKRGRRAAVRFWLVFAALLVVSVVLSVTIWHEIQRLFGL
jgi:hypothetical protein